MKVLGLCGSPATPSKTLIAVKKAVDYALVADPSISAEVINIRDYDVKFCNGQDSSSYEGDTQAIIQKIVEADALIIGTPMYRGSYTGILKNIFDIIPNDALVGKPIGLIATGGSDHHFLAIEHELKPLLGFFLAYPLPGAVYANNSHYSDLSLVDTGILDRLQKLAQDVLKFSNHMPKDLVGAPGPVIARKSLLHG